MLSPKTNFFLCVNIAINCSYYICVLAISFNWSRRYTYIEVNKISDVANTFQL